RDVDSAFAQPEPQDVHHLLELKIRLCGQRDDESIELELRVRAFEIEARADFAIRLVDGIRDFVRVQFRNDVEGRHGRKRLGVRGWQLVRAVAPESIPRMLPHGAYASTTCESRVTSHVYALTLAGAAIYLLDEYDDIRGFVGCDGRRRAVENALANTAIELHPAAALGWNGFCLAGRSVDDLTPHVAILDAEPGIIRLHPA